MANIWLSCRESSPPFCVILLKAPCFSTRFGMEKKQWKEPLPELELTDAQKSKLSREDWLMLATFMERLPNLTKTKLAEISLQLATHLSKKLNMSVSGEYLGTPSAFLIVLYKQMRQDWEI
jgi:hypothetical protein